MSMASSNTTTAPTSSTAADHASDALRKRGEEMIVTHIMTNYVQQIKHELIQFNGDVRTGLFTNYELDTFSRYTYYGYIYGIPLGLLTFGCFFGGIRYRAYRQFAQDRFLPNTTEQYHTNMLNKRQQYNLFDNNNKTKATVENITTSSSKNNTTKPTSRITKVTATIKSPPPPPPKSKVLATIIQTTSKITATPTTTATTNGSWTSSVTQDSSSYPTGVATTTTSTTTTGGTQASSTSSATMLSSIYSSISSLLSTSSSSSSASGTGNATNTATTMSTAATNSSSSNYQRNKPIVVTLFTPSNPAAAMSSFPIFPKDDTITTLHFFISMAMGIWTSVFTWNYFFNWDQLHEDVSTIPLQSGPSSPYCTLLCNELLKLVSTSPEDQIHHHYMNSYLHVPLNDENDKNVSLQQQLQQRYHSFSVQELWEDPITENLHRMKRLLHNCQQRHDFIQKEYERHHHRIQQQHKQQQETKLELEETPKILITIPEPSLPLRYHSIPVSK